MKTKTASTWTSIDKANLAKANKDEAGITADLYRAEQKKRKRKAV